VEQWNTWNTGTVEQWNSGTLEHWNSGTVAIGEPFVPWNTWNTGTLEHWNLPRKGCSMEQKAPHWLFLILPWYRLSDQSHSVFTVLCIHWGQFAGHSNLGSSVPLNLSRPSHLLLSKYVYFIHDSAQIALLRTTF
jgi:hypothetical protein